MSIRSTQIRSRSSAPLAVFTARVPFPIEATFLAFAGGVGFCAIAMTVGVGRTFNPTAGFFSAGLFFEAQANDNVTSAATQHNTQVRLKRIISDLLTYAIVIPLSR